MQRTPEPELMTEEEQARAYAHADFREPHSRLAALLLERCGTLPASGAALDLGCGPGDISIRIARALPGWSIDGVDGSAAMLRHGREAVRTAGLEARVRLVEAYLPGGEAPRPSYDLVFSNALLHHLADPQVIWQAARRWAKPGAPIVVTDLLRPASREEAARVVETHSGGEPEVLRRDFFNSLLAAYRLDEVRAQLERAGLAHFAVEACSDRHLIVFGRA